MPITWTPELDRALSSAVERYQGESWPYVAQRLSSDTGLVISADAANKRYLRIERAKDATGTKRVLPDTRVEVGKAPGFAGLDIAFYDIETSDLKAFVGTMLCASVCDQWANITHRTLWDFDQDSLVDDKGLCVWLRDELEKFDVTVGWNNFMFDQSFLNARLMRWGERPMRDMLGIDPMWKAKRGRYGLNIGSARLGRVAEFFKTPHQKPDLPPETWILAERGDREAMDLLLDRCDGDVLSTRDVFHHLKRMIRAIHR